MRNETNRRRAVFVDRDGVVNELAEDPDSGLFEGPLTVDDARLLPDVTEALERLREEGFLLVGVTNQPAAAKLKVTRDEIMAIQDRVVELLGRQGVEFDGWRMCLHHPDGLDPELGRACECRKPAPGMLLDAADELGIDLSRSWMIGDTSADLEAGRAAGVRTVLVEHPPSSHKRSGDDKADLRASDLTEAVALLIASDRRC